MSDKASQPPTLDSSLDSPLDSRFETGLKTSLGHDRPPSSQELTHLVLPNPDLPDPQPLSSLSGLVPNPRDDRHHDDLHGDRQAQDANLAPAAQSNAASSTRTPAVTPLQSATPALAKPELERPEFGPDLAGAPASAIGEVAPAKPADIVISLKNVGKSFQRYAKPIDRLKELLLPNRQQNDLFWAVKDLTLEVPRGQTLGIVGRNGSGKSTTLQMVVGTLQPSQGTVQVNGRISALLELGSGFNPEFTGRQNVFFNGQMLGLSRQELEAKFDKIAAFADIGEFLDEPVKTYSSGMFVRLAFAVAVHTDPDILVVDEALSVGDEAFQRKCFARIHAIRDNGGTILFVSHGAATIVELCDRAILIDRGELLLDGNPKLVVDKYQKLIYAPPKKAHELRDEIRRLNGSETVTFSHKELTIIESMAASGDLLQPIAPRSRSRRKDAPTLKAYFDPDMRPHETVEYIANGAKIRETQITSLDGKPVNHLVGREEYLYTYTVAFDRDATQVRFGMLIKTVSGLELGGASLVGRAYSIDSVRAGSVAKVKFRFKCLLNPGAYFVNAGVSGTIDGSFGYLDRRIDAAMFKVQSEEFSWASGIVDLMVDPDVAIYEEAVAMVCEGAEIDPPTS